MMRLLGELTLTDPIEAEAQMFELLQLFKEARNNDKEKIKIALLKVIKKSEAKKQSYVSAIYKSAYNTLEGMI